MQRLFLALGLLVVLAWVCLLFGVGLDDLADGRTAPGVIFSMVMIPVILLALLYAIWRALRPTIQKRPAKFSR